MMALMLCAGAANAAYVTIGGAGNANDTANPYGGVSYEYKISSTEVSIAEFQAYRTATSTTGNEGYWNETGNGRTVGTDAPASYVSLYEAMKYCNYLTSGNVNDGVYTFNGSGVYQSTLSRASIMSGSLDAVATDVNKIYALPTDDEWYKAAYYSVSGGSYSLYADGTSDTGNPPAASSGTTGWNYGGTATRDTAHGSPEQNSTVNMMGNVWEWMEDSGGVLRGGGFYSSEFFLRSSLRNDEAPSIESASVGFRTVEVVPEPATAGMLALSGLLITAYRRIRKNYGC